MGSLRFWLAVVVAAGHLGLIGGINWAAVSLLIFYIISGFAISGLYTVRFEGKKNGALSFAVDRILRIYPSFWIFCLLTYVILMFSPTVHLIGGNRAVLSNVTLVTLNLEGLLPISWLKLVDGGFNFLLPQSWSLASELQFYFLVPYIFAIKHRFRFGIELLFCISILIFALASLGVLDTEHFGYRWLPGTLFLFCTGMLFYDGKDRFLFSVACPAVAILFLCVILFAEPGANYVTEGFIAFLIGTPLVRYFTQLKSIPRADYLMGELSYPLYLSHFAVLWLLGSHHGSLGNRSQMLVELFLSLTVAYVAVYTVERPLQTLRRSFRPEAVE